jgi:endogenous inhibitor of DNA gyrase (YacG/DUF329 family)
MALEEHELQETCPTCGKPLAEWSENDGQGVISGGVTYCSSECGLLDAAQADKD